MSRQLTDNARYAKLRGMIMGVKRPVLEHFEMPTVAKCIQRIVDEGIVAKPCVSSFVSFKDFRSVRPSEEWKVYKLEGASMIAKQDYRDIPKNTFASVSVPSNFPISLIDNRESAGIQIFLRGNLGDFFCDVGKCAFERDFSHD